LIRHYFRKLRKSERGAAMVEFAIIAMLLFTLLFGIIEFAWLFNGYITLEAAAKEGVRLAIIGASDEEIETAIKNHAFTFLDSGGFIDDIDIGTRTGHETYVTIIGNLPLLINFFFFIDNPFEMKATAYMLQES